MLTDTPDAAVPMLDSAAASAELQAVQAELANERSHVKRLRTDIATASMALEVGKTRLETVLQEADVYTPTAPRDGAADGAADDDDETVVRLLEAQIQDTDEGLTKLKDAEKALVAEIESLRALEAIDDSRSSHEGTSDDSDAEVASSVKKLADGLRDDAVVFKREALDRSPGSSPLAAPRLRERSLPNLSLLQESLDDADPGAKIESGVVVERVFDGIVAFSSGSSRIMQNSSALVTSPGSSREYEIQSCADKLTAPSEEQLASALSEYCTLTIETSGRKERAERVELIGVKSALECVRQLIESHTVADNIGALAMDEDEDEDEFDEMELPSILPLGVPKTPSAEDVEESGSLKNSRSSLSDLVPNAVDPLPSMSHQSKVLSAEMFGQLMGAMPARHRNCDMQRLYCTDEDGISLATLYKKVENRSPTIICIRDTHNEVFGCFAPAPWKDTCSRSYGTGESFVFRGVSGDAVEVYKWTRKNHFFQLSSHEHLAIGGGGHFALWIDDELSYGTTAQCNTFDNPALTRSREDGADDAERSADTMVDFEIVVAEAWAPVPRGHLRPS